jgi:hypothetical protein
MENPATWGRAEQVVASALLKWREAKIRGVIGLTDVRAVTDALRAEGLLAPRTCTCAVTNCGPDACNCTTPIMDCPVHADSDAGQAERGIVLSSPEAGCGGPHRPLRIRIV